MRFRFTGKQAVRVAGCILFCLIICAMAFLNRTLIMEPAVDLLHGSGFQKAKKTVQDNLLGERLRGRDELLSLNGGYAGLQGRSLYNQVQRMTNGMLISPTSSMMDTTDFVNSLDRFHRFLQARGIPFLFVLAPYKEPTSETLLPTGVTDMTNAIADRTLGMLAERNVPYLDLRETMSRTKEQVEKYFYRTDHHWNADGSFFAYQQIMEAIQSLFPDTKMTYADSSLWEEFILPNWWLGAQGKRVGPYFAGTEDLDYYLPAFETHMTRYSIGVWAVKGTFRDANIREWYLEYSDYMKLNHYFRYLGGGYPLTLHRNAKAENQLNLLMIGDSFKHPVEAFLSTEFTSLDVLDPRQYGKMKESDYVRLNPPDMVIVLNFPGTLWDDGFSNLGSGGSDPVIDEESQWNELSIRPIDLTTNYEVLPVELKSGKSYILTVDQIRVDEGYPAGANVILCDNWNYEVDQTIFDIDYGNQFGFRWGFRIPESDDSEATYHLRFYAGISEGTANVGLTYQGIQLQECMMPN